MKYKKSSSKKFFTGNGFYIVLAGCLIATGVAAWTAFAGANPQTETPNDSQHIASKDEASSETPAGTDASEPYSSESELPIDDTPSAEPIVAENFFFPINGNVQKSYSDTQLIYSATFKDMRLHSGVDIQCETGSIIKSCGEGVVVAIIEDNMLGRYIEIDHGNGIVVKYCGIDDASTVKEGDIVEAGTPLGALAIIPCECADSPHLHLEFYKDEYPIDPMIYLE